MDVSHILDELNDAQREAVTSPEVPVLVLAGAGSGKTRVLIHRIAWLIEVTGASPHSVMAVTFTNKAAAEMRSRAERMLKTPVGGMWVGTFHGLAHRFLRQHWHDAGLMEGFQILDSDDQYRLIRRVMKGLEIDESRYPPRQVQWFINGRKDEGQRPQHLNDYDDVIQAQMIRIYSAYEDACQRAGLVDFAELLLRAHETLRDNASLLNHYQQRFRHILVDEFQDTNSIQYAWVRLLAGGTSYPFVVGDDDQSIYGWRGARIENILNFEKDFSTTHIIRLEQNYRSTANILAAANALITHNTGRMGKNLWTEDKEGTPIQMYAAWNDREESNYVVDRVTQLANQGYAYNDMAILYRSNAQSRVFEELLIARRIPYRVYGGLRFFERAEIKDALAYLRLVNNRHDDPSFERVVNMPTRGIGERT
ncbi:MAG: DNA helicase II, partial [Gammaproteobacteria bacterium]